VRPMGVWSTSKMRSSGSKPVRVRTPRARVDLLAPVKRWMSNYFPVKRCLSYFFNGNGAATQPERGYPPNRFGLRSMSGNVYEWCQDWRGAYPDGPVVDPEGPGDGRDRVLRGGSWYGIGRFLRSAYRGHILPGYRYGNFGLRLAGGFDPRASQLGAGAMTADGRARSDRQGSGQGVGEGAGS